MKLKYILPIILLGVVALSRCNPVAQPQGIFFPDSDEDDEPRPFERRRPTTKNTDEDEDQGLEDFGLDASDDSDDVDERDELVRDDDSVLLEGSLDPATALDACAGEFNALPFSDPDSGLTLCYFVGTQGPCLDEFEWWVLDREPGPNGEPRGVCAERPCADGFALFDGHCTTLGNSRECPPAMELLVSPFGEGECGCGDEYLAHEDEMGQLRCYQEATRGPCDAGEQFADVSNEPALLEANPMGAACVENPCPEGQLSWTAGQCLVAPEEECKGRFPFLVVDEANEGRLKCQNSFGTRQLLIIPEKCPDGQSMNHDGECKEVVKFGQLGSSRPPRRLATRRLDFRRFLRARFGQ